jgi:HSP20 family protein
LDDRCRARTQSIRTSISLLIVEIPGVKKDDLDVSVSEKRITIRGITSHEEAGQKGRYLRCEISRGDVSRTITLPLAVDVAKAEANFENGVFTLALPKLQQVKRLNIEVE